MYQVKLEPTGLVDSTRLYGMGHLHTHMIVPAGDMFSSLHTGRSQPHENRNDINDTSLSQGHESVRGQFELKANRHCTAHRRIRSTLE